MALCKEEIGSFITQAKQGAKLIGFILHMVGIFGSRCRLDVCVNVKEVVRDALKCAKFYRT